MPIMDKLGLCRQIQLERCSTIFLYFQRQYINVVIDPPLTILFRYIKFLVVCLKSLVNTRPCTPCNYFVNTTYENVDGAAMIRQQAIQYMNSGDEVREGRPCRIEAY